MLESNKSIVTEGEPCPVPDRRDVAVSIVIPLFNEETILQQNLEALADFFDRMVGQGKWRFILVDNGSTDTTPKLVEDATRRWPPSAGVRLTEPNYGAALKAGLRAATEPWVYMLDIEQWDIPFIAWTWMKRENYDAFIASKRADPTLNKQHYYRRILSWGLNCVLQVLFQFTGTDTHGAKLLNRDTLEAIIFKCQLDRGQFDTELVLRATRAGFRLMEIPSPYAESRPPRNWMIKKIVWNILAIQRLTKVMKSVDFEGPQRCYRIAYGDVLIEAEHILAPAKENNVV